MKTKILSTIIALSATLCLSGKASAETYYPMQCTGGGQMHANYYPGQNYIEIFYKKAAQGANATAPGPGECAWMDRPIRDGEPQAFRLQLSGGETVQRFLFGPGASSFVGGSLPPSLNGRSVGYAMEVTSGALSQLIQAINFGGRCSMQATGSGGNYFKARQVLC